MREVYLAHGQSTTWSEIGVYAPFGVDGSLEDEGVARHEAFEATRPPVSVNLAHTCQT